MSERSLAGGIDKWATISPKFPKRHVRLVELELMSHLR